MDRGPSDDAKPWAGGGGRQDLQDPPTGGEYGDLYIILRDGNGLPEMIMIKDDEGVENWYVQPINYITENGELVEDALDLNNEGEVIDERPPIEVDFGRLNIVRSPPSVLDQAFEEAMKVLDPENKVQYPHTISLDFCGRLTSHYYNEELEEWVDKTIDSPRENMAIYKEIMNNLFTEDLDFLGTLGFDPLTIAASCFAAGSDKTGTVDKDEVVYINGFMDCIGLNPIEHEYEKDFDNNYKWYFNFSDPDPEVSNDQFVYDRFDTYADRNLRIKTLFSDGHWEEDIVSVFEAMTNRSLFNGRWDQMGYLTPVELFAQAVDDAVQVLNFVHGDSNIEFLP